MTDDEEEEGDGFRCAARGAGFTVLAVAFMGPSVKGKSQLSRSLETKPTLIRPLTSLCAACLKPHPSLLPLHVLTFFFWATSSSGLGTICSFSVRIISMWHGELMYGLMRPCARYVRLLIFGALLTWMCSMTRESTSRP